MNDRTHTGVRSVDVDLDGMTVVDEFVGGQCVVRDDERALSQRLTERRLARADHYRRLTTTGRRRRHLLPVLRTYQPTIRRPLLNCIQ